MTMLIGMRRPALMPAGPFGGCGLPLPGSQSPLGPLFSSIPRDPLHPHLNQVTPRPRLRPRHCLSHILSRPPGIWVSWMMTQRGIYLRCRPSQTT